MPEQSLKYSFALAAAPKSYRRAVSRDLVFQGALWACGLIGFLLPVAIIAYLLIGGIHSLSWEFIFASPAAHPRNQGGDCQPFRAPLPWSRSDCSSPSSGPGGWHLFIGVWPMAAVHHVGPLSVRMSGRGSPDHLRALRLCLPGGLCQVWGLAAGRGHSSGLHHVPDYSHFGARIAGGLDVSYRDMALSLGVTRAYLIRKVLLPKARRGIMGGVVLAVGHAVGSAAPILFTASVYFSKGGIQLHQPVMTLPTHLYNLVSEAISFEHAFGTALVLIMGLLLFNTCALLLRRIGVTNSP